MTIPIRVRDNLWVARGPDIRWFTMPFPTRMVIMRLADGSLVLHSPIELTNKLQAAVEDLGQPRYLVSPNKLHHMFWAQWQITYPEALSYAPPGLAVKRPDLTFAGELGDTPEPEWAEEIDQLVFKGSHLMEEVVFFHKPSRTVIFGDMVENFDPESLSLVHRGVARLGHVLAPEGQTPLDFRQTFKGGRDQALESYRRLLAWQPTGVIMCHGVPVFEQAEQFIEHAFEWLDGTEKDGT